MRKNNAHTTLLPEKSTNFGLVAFLSLIISFVAILPILCLNKGNLFLLGDYMTQQIPFIRECRRVVLSGAPFWSPNTFLGANFIGSYAFYVPTSPFFWPLLAVPEGYVGIALGVMFILKHIVAALTSHLYISKYTKNVNLAVIGALIYTFSSFTMDSSFYYHFIEIIAFFPLLLYYTDRILENRSKVMFMLVVLFTAVLNFYFFIGTSFLFLFYIFFKIRYSDKYTWKDGFRSIIFYGIGAIGSAIILLPAGLSMLETSKAAQSFSGRFGAALAALPQTFKTIEALVLPSEGIIRSGAGFTHFVYCSTAAFLPFFGALFLFIALRRKEKSWDFNILKFFMILSFIPFGKGLFTLYTSMSYTRWWYGFVLISVIASIHIIEDMDKNPEETKAQMRRSSKIIAILASIVTFGPLVVKVFSIRFLKDYMLNEAPEKIRTFARATPLFWDFTANELRYSLVLIFMTLISYLPLYFAIKKGWITKKVVVPVVAVICMLTYCVYLTNEHRTYKSIYPLAYVDEAQPAVGTHTEYSHRVENKRHLANFSLLSNEPGISTFSTVKSFATADFARISGYICNNNPATTRYSDTQAIQSVLSVKEIVNQDGTRESAPYYVPMGFVYDYYVEDVDIEFTRNRKENDKRTELMVQACYLDEETAAKLKGIVEPLSNNSVPWQDACIEKRKTACTDFVMDTKGFRAVSEGDKERLVFFSIPHDNGWKAYINGEETEIYTVNGGLMGVVAPEGRSEIEFKFMPPGFIPGAVITAVVLVGIAGFGIFEIIKKKKEEKE